LSDDGIVAGDDVGIQAPSQCEIRISGAVDVSDRKHDDF
jgi:hypothetical protein